MKWVPNSPLVPIYRFYSKEYGGHFFTKTESEMLDVFRGNPKWNFEGVAYFGRLGYDSGSTRTYRFYSKKYRAHFYTVSVEEYISTLKNSNWKFEPNDYYYTRTSSGNGASPVWRFWNGKTKHHFYTTSYDEQLYLRRNNPNWKWEGIKFYAWAEVDDYEETKGLTTQTKTQTLNGQRLASECDAIDSMGENERNDSAMTFRSDVAWSLETRPDAVAIAPVGETDLGDILVETRFDAPEMAELHPDGNDAIPEVPSFNGLALRLSLPGGAFDAALWSAAEGTVAEESGVEGAFDFDLPVDGVWHWLRVRDAADEDAFSVWLRAE